MISADQIGSLVSSFVDGAIVLNEKYEVKWHNLDKNLKLSISPHDTAADIFPNDDLPTILEEQEQRPLKMKGRTFIIETKCFIAEQKYFILCITEKKQCLSNTKTRLHCLEEIMESLDEGVLMSNPEGEIVLYNQAQEKMEGLSKEKTIGKHLWSAYNYNPQYSEHKHVFKTGKPIFSRYRAHSTINGVPKYVYYSTFPIIKDGETIAVYSISTNESRLKNRLHQTIEVKRKLKETENKNTRRENGTIFTFDDIKGNSLALQQLLEEAQNISLHNTDVLIVGETGTGKELFAQSLHNHSPRADNPFVAINCAAIPENLLESTLFGSVEGAFTGAVNQAGLFEHAGNGTLFLDEINSMPVALQTKLMRVLQERIVRRVGSNEVTPVCCCVISASNEDPEKLINEDRLRLDLFYRIAHTSLYIPPLRERPEDIQFFINYFLDYYKTKFSKPVPSLSKPLIKQLLGYSWPGNTRELDHLMENLVIRASETDTEISRDHLPSYMKRKMNLENSSDSMDNSEGNKQPLRSVFKNSQEHYIKTALEDARWNISKAARHLGITRQSLQYHMKKHGIKKPM